MKTVDIEQAVRWAYRDELPKARALDEHMAVLPGGFGTPWGSVSRYGELLEVVQQADVRNRFGLFPDVIEAGEPHADAVVIADAVEALADCLFEMPEGWNPLADMGDLGVEGGAAIARGLARLTMKDEAGNTVLRRSPAQLVIRHAILGGAPVWEADAPERILQQGPHGKPLWFRRLALVSEGAFGPTSYEVEVDGFDHKRRRPYADAYQRVLLVPDPADAVAARAEYEIWHGALSVLAEELPRVLRSRAVAPPARMPRPWEVADPERRILPSLLTPQMPVLSRRKKNSMAA